MKIDELLIDSIISISYVGEIILITLELFLSALLAGVIGYEREKHGHAAGLRTHILVSLGAALVMIVSISAPGLDVSQVRDPARLAAQVVSGIGFLGAGTIIQNGTDIRGLTTAATIWLCGGIGLACGAGYLSSAVITLLIVMVALTVLTKLEARVYAKSPRLIIKMKDDNHVLKDIIELANVTNVEIKELHSSKAKEDDAEVYTFYITLAASSYNYADKFAEQIQNSFSPLSVKLYKK